MNSCDNNRHSLINELTLTFLFFFREGFFMNLDTDEIIEYGINTNRSSEHLGDCLELMPLIVDESIDMILCDLPYGTTACKWDSILPLDKLWNEYNRIIKPDGVILLTASQPFTTTLISSNLKGFKYCWYWDKLNAGSFATAKYKPLSVFEDICIFSKNGGKTKYFPIMEQAEEKNKRPRDKQYERKDDNSNGMGSGIFKTSDNHNEDLRYPKNRLIYNNRVGELNALNRLHPTQKPVEMFAYLIKTYTNENDIVLDNTAGAFTTAIACLQTNRKYIVMEKEKEYYNKGLKRILEWEREQKTKLL